MRGLTSSLLALGLAIGCGKESGGGSGGGGAGGGAPAAGNTPASGDCKPVLICDSVPTAHVDALCGTKSTKGLPRNTDGPMVDDSCQYQNDNGNATVSISRVCFTGGADPAKQMFTSVRAETNAQRETTTALPGLGDEAFYRPSTDHTRAVLIVRKGNAVTEVVTNTNFTAETEEGLKTKCLVALYNEVAAK